MTTVRDSKSGKLASRLTAQIALAVFALLAMLVWIWRPVWNWEHYVLPEYITVNRILASSSASGLGEGCQSVVYELSDQTMGLLQTEGLSYLERASKAHRNYAEWRETPGDIDLAKNGRGSNYTIFGLYAMDGCDSSGVKNYMKRDLSNAISKPGAFFAVSQNREGIVLLVPKLRLAAFYYFG